MSIRICSITVLGSASSYLDRLDAISQLLTFPDANIVVCQNASNGIVEEFQAIRFIIAEPGLRGIRFFWWAARTAFQTVCNSGRSADSWFITEVASCYVTALLKVFFRTRANLVSHQVMTNVMIWRERGWRRDPFMPPLSASEDWYFRKRFFVWQVMSRLGAITADGVMANSRLNVEELNLGTKPSVVLPNSVRDPWVEKAGEKVPRSYLTKIQELHDGVRPLRLVLVAKIEPHKGIGFALETVRRLKRLNCSVELRVIGSYPKEVRRWVIQLKKSFTDVMDRVSFLGSLDRDTLGDCYAWADALFLPTFYEGSPRVVYEACAHGCGAVVSDISGTRVIDPNREFLVTFPPGDIDACCSAIKQLSNGTRQLGVASARNAMVGSYKGADIADQMMKFYRIVASSRSPVQKSRI